MRKAVGKEGDLPGLAAAGVGRHNVQVAEAARADGGVYDPISLGAPGERRLCPVERGMLESLVFSQGALLARVHIDDPQLLAVALKREARVVRAEVRRGVIVGAAGEAGFAA